MAHRVRLVGVQDAGYRAKSAHYRRLYVQGRPDRGPPPPGSRVGRVLEGAARVWLGERLPNAGGDRILEVKLGRPDGWGFTHDYREVDAVLGSADAPVAFVEVKASHNPHGAEHGRAQVLRTVRIARSRWPDLRALVLWIDLRGDEAVEDPRTCEHVDDVDAWLSSPLEVPVLRLPAAPLWQASLQAGFGADEDWQIVRAEARDAVAHARAPVDPAPLAAEAPVDPPSDGLGALGVLLQRRGLRGSDERG